MYKIIGIDGRQYGPVSDEQIRQWIAAGRADAEIKAQKEGEEDWKPLSAFPEFAEALASKAAPPPPTLDVPPPLGESPSVALEKAVVESKTAIDVGSCLGRAWDLLMSDMWTLIGICLLYTSDAAD